MNILFIIKVKILMLIKWLYRSFLIMLTIDNSLRKAHNLGVDIEESLND